MIVSYILIALVLWPLFVKKEFDRDSDISWTDLGIALTMAAAWPATLPFVGVREGLRLLVVKQAQRKKEARYRMDNNKGIKV